MAATVGTGLGTRPLRGLLCNHSDVLPRLAAATPHRGNTCGIRGAAGGLASVYAGSLVAGRGSWRGLSSLLFSCEHGAGFNPSEQKLENVDCSSLRPNCDIRIYFSIYFLPPGCCV
jgi:hypothetical protein